MQRGILERRGILEDHRAPTYNQKKKYKHNDQKF